MPNCSSAAIIPPIQDWLWNPPTSHPLDSEYLTAEMQPNPDISGIGVFTGFVSTAWIVFGLLVANYFYAHDPAKDPFRPNDSSVPSRWKANVIDVKFLYFVRKIFRIKRPSSRMQQVFDECILDMCDIQLMTGFAILISGFSQLSPSDSSGGVPLSAYHWYLIASIAWFSTVTHLSGLTVIRSYLHQHRAMNSLRVVLMATLLVLVVVAQIPTGYFNWSSLIFLHKTAALPMSPAVCYLSLPTAQRLWNDSCNPTRITFSGMEGVQGYFCDHYPRAVSNAISSEAMQAMVFGVGVLLLSFATRCVKLSAAASKRFDSAIRQPGRNLATLYCRAVTSVPTLMAVMVSNPAAKQAIELFCDTAIIMPLLSIYISFTIIVDLFLSMFSEVIWTLFILLWGTLKLVGLRKGDLQLPGNVIKEEDGWTFGQVMAVVLIASPLLSMFYKFTVDMNKPDSGSQSTWNGQSHIPIELGSPSPPYNRIVLAARDPHAVEKIRAYLLSAFWMGPVVGTSVLAPLLVIFGFFLGLSDLGTTTMTVGDFWFSIYPFSAYLLVGYPSGCGLTILVVLNLEDWLKRHPKKKWGLIILVVLIGHGGYIIFCILCLFLSGWWQKLIGVISIPLFNYFVCIVIFQFTRLMKLRPRQTL